MAALENGAGTTTGSKIKHRRVTPQQAKDWLKECNRHNRPINMATVSRYAQDIADGNWLDTAETIKFSNDNRLLDGQHRLAAIVESGRSMKVWVATGMDSAIFDRIDTGRPRKLSDCLAINGVPNANTVAAAVKQLYQILVPREARLPWTNHLGLIYLEEHPKIIDVVKNVFSCGSSFLVANSPAAAIWYRLRMEHVATAKEFMERVLTQQGLDKVETKHEYKLFRILQRAAHNPEVKLGNAGYYQYFFKTWNNKMGERVKVAFLKGQAIPEVAPYTKDYE